MIKALKLQNKKWPMSPPTFMTKYLISEYFGTTYSGYAYSFYQDPLKIFCPQTWFAGEGNLASLKTPTCLLLNPDRSFHSFGYTAENKYVYLASEGKHQDYFFFSRFKMDLHWKV